MLSYGLCHTRLLSGGTGRLRDRGAMFLGSGVAGADGEVRYGRGPGAWTLASGPLCGGMISASTVTSTELQPGPGQPWRDNRGQLAVWLTGTFVGISEAPGRQCSVTATVRWRNLDTGLGGVWESGPVSGSIPPFTGLGQRAMLATGSGRVELTLSTDHPSLAGTQVVDVF